MLWVGPIVSVFIKMCIISGLPATWTYCHSQHFIMTAIIVYVAGNREDDRQFVGGSSRHVLWKVGTEVNNWVKDRRPNVHVFDTDGRRVHLKINSQTINFVPFVMFLHVSHILCHTCVTFMYIVQQVCTRISRHTYRITHIVPHVYCATHVGHTLCHTYIAPHVQYVASHIYQSKLCTWNRATILFKSARN